MKTDCVIRIVVQHHTSSIASDFCHAAEREQGPEEVGVFPDAEADVDNGKAGEARYQEGVNLEARMVAIDAVLDWTTRSHRCTTGIEKVHSADHDGAKERISRSH